MIVSLCACSKKSTLIQGKIDNNKSEKLLLKYNNVVDTVLINTDGLFNSDIVLEYATYVNLSYNRRIFKLYLKPGEDINISFDADNIGESKVISGAASAACHYLEEQTNQRFSRDNYKLEEKEFFNSVSELRNKKLDLLHQTEFDEQFKAIESERIKYMIAEKVLKYPLYYPKYTKKDFVYGPTFLHYFDELSLDKEDLLHLKEYKSYIFTYVQWFLFKNARGYAPLRQTQIGLEFIINKLTSSKTKNYLLYKLVSGHIRSKGINNSETLLASFNSNCTDIDYLEKVDEIVSNWAKIEKGQMSPSFNFPDINGKMISLENFKGKYVYIDIWATWCGPCRQEIPHLEKLEEEFHNDAIAFVSISIDKNKEAWEKKLIKDEMGGIQLHAEGTCSFVKDYMVRGIPRFILLDKEGRILNSKAERPSGNIKEVLQSLFVNRDE